MKKRTKRSAPVCKHTKKLGLPPMYIAWRIEMSRKGYVQHQCKGCGAWAVWRKEKNERGKKTILA